jgi:hypothetical protein
MTQRELRELLTRADSYLSLLWYRYVPVDRKNETDLRLAVERTIGDLRRASNAVNDANHKGVTDMPTETPKPPPPTPPPSPSPAPKPGNNPSPDPKK